MPESELSPLTGTMGGTSSSLSTPKDRGSVAKTESSYSAKDITVLEGLEAVRKRPGMYIGSTGPSGLHHLVYEVVDNAVDEAMAGRNDLVDITIHPDNSVTVRDAGAGIPVDVIEEQGMSALTVVMTKLHAGGKFGGDGYKVSGGLHGVGVSVVNALSERCEIEIDREGQHHFMDFAKGGKVQTKLKVTGKAPRDRTGTTVRFWPDPTIFDEVDFRAQTLVERLQMMAFLNKGLEIRLNDQRDPEAETVVFRYAGGIVDFVKHVNASKEALFSRVGYFEQVEEEMEVELAFQWNTGYNTDGLHSFANGINTIEGGMHEEGFKKGLTNVVNKYARGKGLLKEKDANLLGEDIREGLTAIISVRLRDPQFEGQTKGKLGDFLEEHPTEANKIVKKSIAAATARTAARDARNATRRKSALEGAGMPDKLRDCQSRNMHETELFIVEGDSAGGPATQARDPRIQAVLPIRGKILNVERARIDKMLKNNEIQALISAIGAGLGEEFDAEKIRYGKVIILCDADVDGSHIRTLLLTFFFRQMRDLVEHGHVYIAQPPLFSTIVGKDKIYLKDDAAKAAFLAENPTHKKEFQRLKGLGEMDWEELQETTIDPTKRTLLKVSVEQAAIADEVLSVLMGDDVESRKHFIQTNAKDVRFLDI